MKLKQNKLNKLLAVGYLLSSNSFCGLHEKLFFLFFFENVCNGFNPE